MEFNMKTINERIKERRKAEGFTQEDLAKRLNVQRQTISYYETCRTPTIVDLFFLAKELNTSADYLLGISDTYRIDDQIQCINRYTGLDDGAMDFLHGEVELIQTSIDDEERTFFKYGLEFINRLLNSEDFENAIGYYDEYRSCVYLLESIKDYTDEELSVLFKDKTQAEIDQIILFNHISAQNYHYNLLHSLEKAVCLIDRYDDLLSLSRKKYPGFFTNRQIIATQDEKKEVKCNHADD